MKYIDLFAGAGGLSEGFFREGFEAVAHIEKDHHACQTIKTRTAFHYLKGEERIGEYVRYLRNEITRDEFYNLIPSEILETVIESEISKETKEHLFELIDKKLENENGEDGELDLIIGGPPCQAYSSASAYIEEKNEDLIYLYELYGDFLEHFNPKMFIFENVPGIYTADEGTYYKGLKSRFSEAGYCLEDRKLNAANFNVPQKRQRVIIVGWREDLDLQYPELEACEPLVNVNDLLKDLPKLMQGESIEVGGYAGEATEYVSNYIRNGIDVLTHHIARPHNDRDLNIYKMAIDKWEKGVRLKNSDIPKKMRTQKNTSSFLDRFKVVNGEGFSHTMIAHIAKDGHYYIHPDREQLRSISVREAARIQSFPDDYFFEGPRTSIFRQIGNAVPPLMGQELAKVIKKQLEGLDGQ